MNAPARPDPRPGRMTVEEYLVWAEGQPAGRFELVDGQVVAMAAEQVAHVRTKGRAFAALMRAIDAHGLNCEAFVDGMAIRIDDTTVYEPDALVRCGPPLLDNDLLVPDPVIVVGVLSPSTRSVDTGKKFKGYFSLPSLRHYLILDPDDRTVIHHHRPGENPDGPIETRILHARGPDDGPDDRGPELLLDPPGLTLRCLDLFEAP